MTSGWPSGVGSGLAAEVGSSLAMGSDVAFGLSATAGLISDLASGAAAASGFAVTSGSTSNLTAIPGATMRLTPTKVVAFALAVEEVVILCFAAPLAADFSLGALKAVVFGLTAATDGAFVLEPVALSLDGARDEVCDLSADFLTDLRPIFILLLYRCVGPSP